MNLNDFFDDKVKPVVIEQNAGPLTEFRPNPKKGQNGEFKAIVRFLPSPKDPVNKSIISKYYAYIKHPVSQVSMNIDCPSTVGQPDPIQNTFFTLRNSSNPVLQENSKQFSRKQQSVSLIQVISCQSDPSIVGKILVWKYGIKIHEKIKAEIQPPMGEGHNPFNLFTGRPFSVSVKEVSGYSNYDACMFFDLTPEQGGMRIMGVNEFGQPVVKMIVTAETVKTDEMKNFVFNYLKENAPDTEKYEYHPWTAEQTEFVNDCIRIYSNPQATIQALSAAQNPGATPVNNQPMSQQFAGMPQIQQVPQMQIPDVKMPNLGGMPSSPMPAPSMPTMDIPSQSLTQTSPEGFQPSGIPNVDALLNTPEAPKQAAPQMPLDLSDVLKGQIL